MTIINLLGFDSADDSLAAEPARDDGKSISLSGSVDGGVLADIDGGGGTAIGGLIIGGLIEEGLRPPSGSSSIAFSPELQTITRPAEEVSNLAAPGLIVSVIASDCRARS